MAFIYQFKLIIEESVYLQLDAPSVLLSHVFEKGRYVSPNNRKGVHGVSSKKPF